MKAKILKSNDEGVVILTWDSEHGTVATTVSISSLPDEADADGVFDLAGIPEDGTPYGLSDKELAALMPLELIKTSLHNKNMWTLQDLQANPELVARIVASSVRVLLEAL